MWEKDESEAIPGTKRRRKRDSGRVVGRRMKTKSGGGRNKEKHEVQA